MHRFIVFSLTILVSSAAGASQLSEAAKTLDRCNETYVSNRGEDSANFQYFRRLLEIGDSAPLDSFLKLWYPEVGDGSNLESPFFACEKSTTYGFNNPYPEQIPGEPYQDRPVPVNCRPDILYSWGPMIKAQSILSHLEDGGEWKGFINPYPKAIRPGEVDTSMSPTATFGFGRVLLRFKVKRDAPYSFFTIDGNPDHVRVVSGTYHEFQVRNAALLESVSAGTPEIYDEIVRDILRFLSGKRVFVYSNRRLGAPYEQLWSDEGLDRLFSQHVDGHQQDEKVLKENLLELLRQILNGEGKVHYVKGACRSRESAFSTTFPSFIQPFATPNIGQ